jgi:hypothetical protein
LRKKLVLREKKGKREKKNGQLEKKYAKMEI